MKTLEEDLSPQAKLWLERMAEKEEKTPGRVLSQIIEGYMELEEKSGEENVNRLLETLVNGPKLFSESIEAEIAKAADLNEKASNVLQIIRLYCAQIHALRNLNERGEPRYTIRPEEKAILFDQNQPEPGEEIEIR